MRTKKFTLSLSLTLTLSLTLIHSTFIYSQIYTDEDVRIFNSKIELAEKNNLKELSINQIISFIAKSFISTPYEAHTLEISDKEELIINLRTLDCTTFLESVFAISLCIKNNKTSFDDFKSYLQLIRYRDGKIEDYTSRLHYFSDWIYNNQSKNLIKDITKELLGEKKKFNLNFMSSNPHLYKHLNNNPQFIPLIKKQEDEISDRTYYFISENNIHRINEQIKDGDFIALTANVKGLDIGHVGIAVKDEKGRTFFLHAPMVGSYVQITEEPLSDYVKKNKKHTGIIVLRAVE
jgi:hypothetical protein